MRVEKDFEEFIELLNEHRVRYLIIGAYAIAFHAQPRNTGDIDFLMEPNKQNAKRLLKVLHEFGFESLGLKEEDFLKHDRVLQLGTAPNRIDLLFSVSGVTFAEAYRGRTQGRFGSEKAWFISLPHLIRSKMSTRRKKDEADVEFLLKFKKARSRKQ